MKTVHRWLASILCLATLVLLASCATPTTTGIPTDSTVENMSVKQARKVLATELKSSWYFSSGGWGRADRITDVRVMSNRLIVTDKTGKQSIFIYRELPQISLFDSSMVELAGKVTFQTNGRGAGDVANALHVLQQNAIKQKKEADEYEANFTASLADHRKKAASNATLPETANKYKVQAEGAVRDKAFDDAADLYAAALTVK